MSNAPGFKLLLLTGFVLQSTSQTLLAAYNFSIAPRDGMYNINNMLLVVECFKFVFSCLLEAITVYRKKADDADTSSESLLQQLVETCHDGWKMAVPAVLYWIGNSMAYLALANLSAPVFQVLLQMKVLITAFLSVCLLRRNYVLRQWICLLGLSLGVATVALGESDVDIVALVKSKLSFMVSGGAMLDQQQHNKTAIVDLNATMVASTDSPEPSSSNRSTVLGLVAITVCGFSGSMAGVFFEIVLKRRNKEAEGAKDDQNQPQSTKSSNSSCEDDEEDLLEENRPESPKQQPSSNKPEPSVWLRNIQLSFFSIIAAIAKVQYSKVKHSMKDDSNEMDSFFHGFTTLVWVQIVQLAMGGLMVATVIKYADSVLKALATGVSVISATLISIIWMGTELTNAFLIGGSVILASVYFFSNELPDITESKRVPKTIIVLLMIVALSCLQILAGKQISLIFA